MDEPRSFWVAVATADRVSAALAGRFCDGPGAEAMAVGDGLVLYASRETPASTVQVQSFLGIGEVAADEGWAAGGSGAVIRRRPASWRPAFAAEAKPLAPRLSFIKDPARMGQSFRRARFRIPAQDFILIAEEMGLPVWAEQLRREEGLG